MKSCRQYLLPILLLITLVAGCSSESTPAEPKAKILADGAEHIIIDGEPIWPADAVRFEVEQVFGTDEDRPESMLAKPRFVQTDLTGNLYVYDIYDHQLIKFDKNGHQVWRVGQEGQGPAEFYEVSSIKLNSTNEIYVHNQDGIRVDVWDENGTYIRAHTLPDKLDWSTLVAVFGQDSLLIRSLDLSAADDRSIKSEDFPPAENTISTLALLNNQYQIITQFSTPRNIMLIGSDPTVRFADNIITLEVYEDSLIAESYDLSGRRIKRTQIGNRSIGTVGFNEIPGGFVTIYGNKSIPCRLNDHLFIWQTRFTPGVDNGQQALQDGVEANITYQAIVYNSEGKILWKLESKDETSFANAKIIHVDHNEDIYVCTDDPFPQIQRGRLIMPESNN